MDVFDSNIPQYFTEAERGMFRRFLIKNDCDYRVVVDLVGRVIACGGHHIDRDQRVGRLCWGMVDANLHGRGAGWLLLVSRLAAMYDEIGDLRVGLDTSQKTWGFYERAGFVTQSIEPDGYGCGLDKHEMLLELDRARYDSLRSTLTPDQTHPSER